MNREEAKKRVEELEQERDNIYSAWKGACAWEMESFRELEALKQSLHIAEQNELSTKMQYDKVVAQGKVLDEGVEVNTDEQSNNMRVCPKCKAGMFKLTKNDTVVWCCMYCQYEEPYE